MNVEREIDVLGEEEEGVGRTEERVEIVTMNELAKRVEVLQLYTTIPLCTVFVYL